VRVLVVDDDHALMAMVSTLLESEGYAVKIAYNGVEALHYASESPPDLVLLDLHMPVMDGWTCCRLLRQYRQTENIPIIVMSADGKRAAVHAELKVDHFLPKPFEIEDLLSCIVEYVGSR